MLTSVGSLQFTAKFGQPLYIDLVYKLLQSGFILQVLCYLFCLAKPKTILTLTLSWELC
jgi:hypothetical protein